MKNLLKVKTIVTFAITALIIYLAVSGKIDCDKIVLIYSSIIGFYFGTQKIKGDDI
jgi:hypothetical protein